VIGALLFWFGFSAVTLAYEPCEGPLNFGELSALDALSSFPLAARGELAAHFFFSISTDMVDMVLINAFLPKDGTPP
jgi:hypothetical protein